MEDLTIPEFLRRRDCSPRPQPPAEEHDPSLDQPDPDWPEDLRLQTVYYIDGAIPKDIKARWREAGVVYQVGSPPHSGYGSAVVIGRPDAKRVTIFCPYTFEAFNVKADAGELLGIEPQEVTVGKRRWLIDLLLRRWQELQGFGFQRDYDTAVLVFKRLGVPVPEQVMRGGEEDNRQKGGKEAGKKLLKPVKRKSKRGKFLEWFLEEDGVRSVREAMAEFEMTRSNALSYLFMLNKDHGIGYTLVGDTATLDMPDCESPFDDDQWMN